MNVQLFETPDGFGPVARWVYRRDPVTFTTELTTLRTSPWPSDRLLVAAYDGDGVVGAAMQMADGVLLVNGLPPSMAKETALSLAPTRSDLAAVRGTHSTATSFAQAWTEATGTEASVAFEETLYRLGVLTAPADVAGAPRLAGPRDEELLAGWFDAFYVEAFGSVSNPHASRALVAGIPGAGGRVVLWTVGDEPVAMARVHGCLLGMSRIGPVYTPPAHRARGYGAAVTAEAARQARGMGARDVVLFADDANPTSNGVYRRLGFLPVGESVQYAFTPRA
ncbi:N-acetyltransferase [Mycolicibacterium madagascariense]|uniref:N-acetyltransferase n=1 Tax=Mycolicibacterium madagascariense TaxID=212765 RepID=A0A7I7XEV2_9MYCO|nr:GNAT family N-acetyltransferase [Mycolicibacterium madagascariense]MCV7015415.1 GNAT family N-acetyltransferase [Mycolicibacterium madagascariense]BBZ27713.1 N-acetyltransferase [Mycolicibacterium madagascariense]